MLFLLGFVCWLSMYGLPAGLVQDVQFNVNHLWQHGFTGPVDLKQKTFLSLDQTQLLLMPMERESIQESFVSPSPSIRRIGKGWQKGDPCQLTPIIKCQLHLFLSQFSSDKKKENYFEVVEQLTVIGSQSQSILHLDSFSEIEILSPLYQSL